MRHEIGLPGAMALGKNYRESALRLEAFSALVAALENPRDCFFSRRKTRKKSFAPGRTHNRIRSPRLEASGQVE